MRDAVYSAYARRLRSRLDASQAPRHVGVILDGNRRWASSQGSPSDVGHRAGAAKIAEFLGWCEDAGVELVTLWLLSTDNLARDPAELRALLGIIDTTVLDLVQAGRWRIRPVGALDLLPEDVSASLKEAEEATENAPGLTVNVAVGYGGRREVVDAVRALLQEHAAMGTSLDDLARIIDVEHIADHLYTKGQPDPDLVIRTSGEQRLSGFLLWQSAHSEVYFCEAFWPDFREVDFLRALRSYQQRQRRFGA
ncbi:MAG: isoprenyl transferase [Candidatus Nanopelagicales bacterium]|nr:isoprenyl transferase [Candidatus Nanopelagicales bacterium]MDZ4249323.1 isoprenyl transferase [Candidatus Nanopelagicales bacterium]